MTLHNNGDNDDLGAQLTRELHRRTDGMHDAPLAFQDVRGKATSIRRRRQLATGLGVAAALAVIVPTAMFATKGTESDGPTPITQPPTVSDTNTPVPTLHTDDGCGPPRARCDRPADGSAARRRRSSRATGVRPRDHPRRRSPWADGVVVEAGGRTFGPYPSSHGFAVNAAGTAVAWTTDEGERDGLGRRRRGAVHPGQLRRTDVRVAAITGTDCVRGKTSDCEFSCPATTWRPVSRSHCASPATVARQRRPRRQHPRRARRDRRRPCPRDHRDRRLDPAPARSCSTPQCRVGALAGSTCDAHPRRVLAGRRRTCWPATRTRRHRLPADRDLRRRDR